MRYILEQDTNEKTRTFILLMFLYLPDETLEVESTHNHFRVKNRFKLELIQSHFKVALSLMAPD